MRCAPQNVYTGISNGLFVRCEIAIAIPTAATAIDVIAALSSE